MTADTLTQIERMRLRSLISSAFSPSAPIDRLALFAGRPKQIKAISEAIGTRGRHAMLYGDRGVGKTSLATVLKDVYSGSDFFGVRIAKVNCVESDTYVNAWRKMFAELLVIVEPRHLPGRVREESEEVTLDQFLESRDHVGPGEIRRLCEYASQGGEKIVLVFDEFDRLPEGERALFSDTIKDLSDNSVDTTLVLVGVASDVTHLIREHGSIDRCLVQVHMPLMNEGELLETLDKAASAIGMRFEREAADLIVATAQGLPHYAHLLGQESAYCAVEAGRRVIEASDVRGGIEGAIEKTQETVKTDYHRASQGQRKGTLFPAVLLACALAPADDLGFFSSSDVREPLRRITGEEYDIPNFAQHLDKLSNETARGPVLEKGGAPRRFRFKFRNPLLRPYIIMKGMLDGKVGGAVAEGLKRSKDESRD